MNNWILFEDLSLTSGFSKLFKIINNFYPTWTIPEVLEMLTSAYTEHLILKRKLSSNSPWRRQIWGWRILYCRNFSLAPFPSACWWREAVETLTGLSFSDRELFLMEPRTSCMLGTFCVSRSERDFRVTLGGGPWQHPRQWHHHGTLFFKWVISLSELCIVVYVCCFS